MKGDVFYEVNHLIHCIMSRGTGIEFCWYRLIVVFIGIKYQIN